MNTKLERSTSDSSKTTRGQLLRVLGVSFGLAVTIGNTIGMGILRTPGEIAAQLPNTYLFMAVWLAGGVFAWLCALSVAEVATMLPHSGSHYVFARHVFGDYPGFIVGWADWLSTCGTMALVSMTVGEYMGLLFPRLIGQDKVIATAVVIIFGLLQWRGTRWGSAAQQITTLLKTLAFLALVAACLLFPSRTLPGTSAVHDVPVGMGWLAAVVLSLAAVIYTYDGWQGVIYFSEEVHDPARDIPRSMFGGVAAVIIIYAFVNLAVLHTLPIQQVAGDPLPLATAMARVWGEHADTMVQVVVIVSLLSAINAYQLMCSRVLFAMSRDGLMPRIADRVNRGGTPTASLLLTSAAGIALIATGTLNRLIAWVAFFFVFLYIMDMLAVILLRRREPGRPRGYRTPGYPWTTLAALLGSAAFLVGAVLGDTRNSLYAVLVLAASYPAFRIIRKNP
jgi:APA family basic amino acid/polyamine antiporter